MCCYKWRQDYFAIWVRGTGPDLGTAHRMFSDAFGTKKKELYDKPLELFEQWVQEHFGMSVDELYALPKE